MMGWPNEGHIERLATPIQGDVVAHGVANAPPSSLPRSRRQAAGGLGAPARGLRPPLLAQRDVTWMCPGHHTLTRTRGVMDSGRRHPYGAYARLIHAGRWTTIARWHELVRCLVVRWASNSRVVLILGETLLCESGRRIDGVGWFQGPVRSIGDRVVAPLGPNVVLLALLLIDWRQDRHLLLVWDDVYASLPSAQLPRTDVVSRFRRNAALYEPLPPHRCGQPLKRGHPRPTLQRLAAQVTTSSPRCHRSLVICGRLVGRDLWSRALRRSPGPSGRRP